jgi:hypothetical protein
VWQAVSGERDVRGVIGGTEQQTAIQPAAGRWLEKRGFGQIFKFHVGRRWRKVLIAESISCPFETDCSVTISFILSASRELYWGPDYPTFRFIRRAVSERPILSSVNSASREINHAPDRAPSTFYVLCCFTVQALARSSRGEKTKKLRNKEIHFTDLLKINFYLQIYIIFNTVFVCEIFHLMS